MHEGPVDVEARAHVAREPEHLPEGHEVPLLVIEGAVEVRVLAIGWWVPARGWEELEVGRLVALRVQDPFSS